MPTNVHERWGEDRIETTEDPLSHARSLEEIRAEIDALDDRILDLVAQRMACAQDLAQAKPPGSALRPAREVSLLRRLIERAGPAVSADLVMELWRALIAETVRRQGGIEVVTAGGADPVRLFDLARRHFGAVAKITREEPRAALTRAADNPSAIAALPWPAGPAAGGWWPMLNERRYHGLTLFAALPLRADAGAEPEAILAGAGVPLEPAGGDATLAVAFDPHHRAARALAEGPYMGREIARARETVLIRFDAFVPAQDPALRMLEAAGLDGLRVVGSYARV